MEMFVTSPVTSLYHLNMCHVQNVVTSNLIKKGIWHVLFSLELIDAVYTKMTCWFKKLMRFNFTLVLL